MKRLQDWLKEDDGQDVVEYGLLAAFISVAAIVTIKSIGPLVTPLYQKVQGALQ